MYWHKQQRFVIWFLTVWKAPPDLCILSLPVTQRVKESGLSHNTKSIPFNPFIATEGVEMWLKESCSYPIFLCPFPRLIRFYKVWDSALKLRHFQKAPWGSWDLCRMTASAKKMGSPGTTPHRPGNKTSLIKITAWHKPANQHHQITEIQNEWRKRRGFQRKSKTWKWRDESKRVWEINSYPLFHKLPGDNDTSRLSTKILCHCWSFSETNQHKVSLLSYYGDLLCQLGMPGGQAVFMCVCSLQGSSTPSPAYTITVYLTFTQKPYYNDVHVVLWLRLFGWMCLSHVNPGSMCVLPFSTIVT